MQVERCGSGNSSATSTTRSIADARREGTRWLAARRCWRASRWWCRSTPPNSPAIRPPDNHCRRSKRARPHSIWISAGCCRQAELATFDVLKDADIERSSSMTIAARYIQCRPVERADKQADALHQAGLSAEASAACSTIRGSCAAISPDRTPVWHSTEVSARIEATQQRDYLRGGAPVPVRRRAVHTASATTRPANTRPSSPSCGSSRGWSEAFQTTPGMKRQRTRRMYSA